MDSKVNMQCAEKTLFEFIQEEEIKKYLLLDNLEVHKQSEFKKAVHDDSGLVWFGLPNGTDLWQPVDAGFALVLKARIGIEHRDWLDKKTMRTGGFVTMCHFQQKKDVY